MDYKLKRKLIADQTRKPSRVVEEPPPLPKLTKKQYTEAVVQIKEWIYGKNNMKVRVYLSLLDQVEAYEMSAFGKVKKK